jgi:hypothetical protein
MINRLRIYIGFALGVAGTPAAASTADWGSITGVYAISNGTVLFNTSGLRSGKPGCQGPGLEARWALDGSTVAGQAQIAILLNAYNTKKKIIIAGQNSCTIWGDTETVLYFLMQD